MVAAVDPFLHTTDRQALGRSRGGLTTKVHLACNGRGLPLAVVVTPGNVGCSGALASLLFCLPRQFTADPFILRRLYAAPSGTRIFFHE